MSHSECVVSSPVYRLIPSRYPTILLFDWAETQEELEEIAALEGLTNDRLQTEYGNIYLVAKADWIGGPGSTPLMAAFTHPGNSRFADGTYGVYYAADCIGTAVAETKFHRERFLSASKEKACLIQMREYTSNVQKKLVNMCQQNYSEFLHPDPQYYVSSQAFARDMRTNLVWGLYYPSVRNSDGKCVAIFRPPALSIPVQGRHLDYIWNGDGIVEVRISKALTIMRRDYKFPK